MVVPCTGEVESESVARDVSADAAVEIVTAEGLLAASLASLILLFATSPVDDSLRCFIDACSFALATGLPDTVLPLLAVEVGVDVVSIRCALAAAMDSDSRLVAVSTEADMM